MKFQSTRRFAKEMDRVDPLRSFRKQFLIPFRGKEQQIYLAGNSLGLQPKDVKKYIASELEDWASLGVQGHEHSRRPWIYYHKLAKKALARIVGAKRSEVVAMNQLTVNLHLLMVSFYRPTPGRYKILCEAGAFPSDQYALESQINYHGMNPAEVLIEVRPRTGEHTLRTEDILDAIKAHSSELSLILIGGVQYYTGQFFDIPAITRAGHDAGAYVGFDLAHAIGNVPLSLHQHGVDFAVWCSYKYLNSGPGGIAGAFIHETHGKNFQLPRFAGWWGHDEAERFQMKAGFKPMPGVDGWQLSNIPVLQTAAHLAALELFQLTSMSKLRKKSALLTGYLEYLLKVFDPEGQFIQIITPAYPWRGCQLSLLINHSGKQIFDKISDAGIVADWREPNVIRVAPTPFYNTYKEVFRFVEIFRSACLSATPSVIRTTHRTM